MVPADSSPIFFQIRNDSLYPLTHLRPALGLCRVIYKDSVPLVGHCTPEGQPLDSLLVPEFWKRNELAPDRPYTLALQEFLNPDGSPIEGADISISLTYKPWFLWFDITTSQRFETRMEQDGKLYWFEK